VHEARRPPEAYPKQSTNVVHRVALRIEARSARIDPVAATSIRHRFADGTSPQEIDPDFFQPARKSHVRGRYTSSGS
jgi:hypothetical protein